MAVAIGVTAGTIGGKKVVQMFGVGIGYKISEAFSKFQMNMASKKIPRSWNSVLGNFHQPMDPQEARLILGLE